MERSIERSVSMSEREIYVSRSVGRLFSLNMAVAASNNSPIIGRESSLRHLTIFWTFRDFGPA